MGKHLNFKGIGSADLPESASHNWFSPAESLMELERDSRCSAADPKSRASLVAAM